MSRLSSGGLNDDRATKLYTYIYIYVITHKCKYNILRKSVFSASLCIVLNIKHIRKKPNRPAYC